MWFWSANFGNRELRMVQKTLEICVSETHASGNREVWIKDLSHPSNVYSRCKGKSEKGIKGHKEGSQKRQATSTLLHWWTSATSKKTSTSWRMLQEQSQVWTYVRVHPGECSQEPSQVWKIPRRQLTWMVRNIPNRYTIEELYTNITEEMDDAGIRATTVHYCAKGRELR